MSSYCHRYRIHYDSNMGPTFTEDIYIKFDASTDYQTVVDSNGEIVDCRGTDSYIKVLGALLCDEPTNDKYFYWEVIKLDCSADDLPEAVAVAFNYRINKQNNNSV